VNPAYLSALANHLWQSTVFAGVAGLLTLLLRNNRARVRHGVWLAASWKFLIPFSVLISLGGQIHWWTSPETIQSNWSVVIDGVSQPFTDPAPSPALSSTAQPAAHLSPTVLLSVWACGFIGIASSWWIRLRRIRASVRSASPAQMPIAVPVKRSATLMEPGVYGIIRPVLILPEGIFERLTPAQLDAVIAHELCHVRHRDNLIAAVQMLVESIFWFHPLVWWIGKRMIEERERACDEEVLQLGREPRTYAEGIIAICKLCVESPLVCVSGVGGPNLRKRITAIMNYRAGAKLSFAKKAVLVATGSAVLAGPLAVGIMSAPAIRAQSTPAAAALPVFEVASVKRSQPGGRGTGIGTDPGRLRITNASLKQCIQWAYNVKVYQITGPGWLDSDRFDIVAKAGRLALEDRLRLMLQALLADRFELALHRDKKELPVYALTVSKEGAKIHEVKASGKSRTGGGKGRLIGQKISMPEFADLLTLVGQSELGRPVIDQTGLKGAFDIELNWTPENPRPAGEHDGDVRATSEAPGPDIFRALQQQLGLRLESQKGPVEILVIDHARRLPTEN